MKVTDEMVERACAAFWWASWDRRDYTLKANGRELMRRALEAALAGPGPSER